MARDSEFGSFEGRQGDEHSGPSVVDESLVLAMPRIFPLKWYHLTEYRIIVKLGLLLSLL